MQSSTSPAVRAFSGAAATYDRVGPNFFGPWAERLVDLVAPAPGERVLDVATGRGAVLLRAAERVGRTGHATGVDLAEGMVAALTADVQRLAHPHVDVQLMDAERLDFPDGAFDCVPAGSPIATPPRRELTVVAGKWGCKYQTQVPHSACIGNRRVPYCAPWLGFPSTGRWRL